jgi:DNA-binding LytR/AlgR family response regulator
MKVLIIDDERRSASRLTKMVGMYDPSIEVTGRIDSVKNAVLWFESNNHPALIFMDIQLADGQCFDIFEETEIKTPVIFTTAYDKYAIRAFKVNTIDYLLKPFGFKDVKGAMDKFSLLKDTFNSEIDADLKNGLSKSYKTRFLVKTGMHIHSIRVEDIKCILSNEKITYLWTVDNKKFIIDYSLEQLEHLISPQLFFRISRRYLININYILDILIYNNSRLKVLLDNYEDADEIIVSREKVQDFKNWLDR